MVPLAFFVVYLGVLLMVVVSTIEFKNGSKAGIIGKPLFG